MILTPHIGGSTEEAQRNIGKEVADKLIRYSNNGSTLAAVNFPEVSLPAQPASTGCCTSTAISQGCYQRSTRFFPKTKSTSPREYLQTNAQIGYVVIDIDPGERGSTAQLRNA